LFCSLNHKEGCALTHLASIRITMASHRRPLLHTDTQCARDTRRQHVILVGHKALPLFDETLVCWSLTVSTSQMSKRATTLKERVNQAANPCACSHSRVPPTPHAFSLYFSRTHIHIASVIADPCKLCTVAACSAVARTRLRAQGVSMGVPCAWVMGICMGRRRPHDEGHCTQKPSN
jgi:hypothetical protein